MEHFRVLPTDPRVERLTEEQTTVLFQYWLDYDEEMTRKAYREKSANEDMKPSFDPDELRQIGYSDEDIEKITRSFE
jgi:hypothetical protein